MNFTKDNNPRVNGENISRLEKLLRIRFPDDYRTFLMEHNGGVPERTQLYVDDVGDNVLIDMFFGIGVTHYDIADWTNELDEDLPEGFIPIGFDPGANAFLMDTVDGCIYYWDSARHFPCSTDDENTYEVALSFTEFLDKLKAL